MITSFTKNSYPLCVNQCPHQTTQYKFMMHYVNSGDKRGTVQLEHLAQRNAGTKCKHLRKLSIKRVLFCVCVCHHSSSPVVMISKQSSYTFTPAFSFMPSTGTALTASSLCYSNLNCTAIPKCGTLYLL
jgi:hypothetical protein